MSLLQMLGAVYQGANFGRNTHDAMDSSHSPVDRVMSGVGAAGNAMGLTATGLGGTGALGLLGESMGGLGTAIGAGGAAGAATAAGAASGVLGAAAGGYAAGTLLNRGVGEFIGGYQGPQHVQGRGVNGGTVAQEDHRSVSDRIADATHTQAGDRLALRMARHLPVWLGGDN